MNFEEKSVSSTNLNSVTRRGFEEGEQHGQEHCGVVATISHTRTGVLHQFEEMQNFCNSILNATHVVAMNEMKFPLEIGNLGEFGETVNFGHPESQNLLEGGQITTQNPRIDLPQQNKKHQRENHSSDSSNSPKRLHLDAGNDFGNHEEGVQSHDVEMVESEEAPTPQLMSGNNGGRG